MKNKTILVVDDEEETLNLLYKKLEEQGYRVLKAASGTEAVQTAKAETPELILMDIMLPDIDGSEAVRLLRNDPRTEGAKVLFLSGIVSEDEGKSIVRLKVGGIDYPAIPKPFTFQQLIEEIRKILDPSV